MDEQEKIKRLEELKKQREELDKLIKDLTESVTGPTNIPYTTVYTTVFPPYTSSIDFSAIDPKDLLQIKIFVNKKCNQVSTDFSHTINLVNEMLPFRDNIAFKEIFLRKLLDQGRVQVSGHFESYKPLSFLLFKLDSPDIINTYVRLLITKQGSESELKGMYAIYFGFLNLKEDIDGCWLWMASILNVNPNRFTGYVLEVFLVICGDLLFEKIQTQFAGILRYIKKFYLKELGNAPVESRISRLLSKYQNC
ncbi:uncharacterized protein VICG_01653 [Vittaforma corneae ATCC 50505]|uniref:Uncharacterized protein n=1 Tax=Vittaforma corneae (strain ATCC 50505) TaxID=993615 RepID=L2GL97_VITCO|nr:uncharacterized protein VICG_01653 [Vittaforma corneae ATCC 50505]ELA41280.1 hypothetical protein VICG_01653 [Vittaforma corneae ATCC 50505]